MSLLDHFNTRRKPKVSPLIRKVMPALAAICVSAVTPEIANAASCEAHFEIRYGSFKPDVPTPHFEAHQTRKKGETDNATRRRAREAAQACMSGLWRDRFLLQKGDPSAAPECRVRLGESTVIRPLSTSLIDLKRELELAACTNSESNMKFDWDAKAKIYKRTHGGPGCGPNLQTVESRFLTDYTFDCQAVRAREGFPVKSTKLNDYQGWDRPGMDITAGNLKPFDTNSQNECMERCEKDSTKKCRAWTWVKAPVPGQSGQCWLKHGVPWARRDDCCISGVIR